MATLPYVGATQVAANDLVNESYVNSLSALNIAQAAVNALISTGFTGYVTKSYVDTQDALNATQAFIDAGDAARLHIANIGVANGIAGLNSTGRIDISRINQASTQRYPKPFLSPAAYNSAAVQVGGTENLLYPISVPDPGFTYKLLVLGTADGSTNTDGQYPIIHVRQGNATTGQIVASGAGLAETYFGGVMTLYSAVGSYTYPVPTWAHTVDCIALGGGGAGDSSYFITTTGGSAGKFATQSLTVGSSLPVGTLTLNATVGAGGASSGVGGASSSVTGTGVPTLTAAGGAGGGNTTSANGAGAGTQSFNEQSYVGGGTQSTGGGGGNAPGGGGASGAAGGFNNGGPGATGAVWFFAAPAPNTPSGPVTVLPTPYNAQTPMTGATTLYVTVSCSGTGSIMTVSPLRPGLMAIPIPA